MNDSIFSFRFGKKDLKIFQHLHSIPYLYNFSFLVIDIIYITFTFSLTLVTLVVNQIFFKNFISFSVVFISLFPFLASDTENWIEIFLSFHILNIPIIFDHWIYFPCLEKLWWLLYEKTTWKTSKNQKKLKILKEATKKLKQKLKQQ